MNYNIATARGRVLLAANMPKQDAQFYMGHYTDKIGKPYPNGKGFYPDLGFRVINAEGLNVGFHETILSPEELARRSVID